MKIGGDDDSRLKKGVWDIYTRYRTSFGSVLTFVIEKRRYNITGPSVDKESLPTDMSLTLMSDRRQSRSPGRVTDFVSSPFYL